MNWNTAVRQDVAGEPSAADSSEVSGLGSVEAERLRFSLGFLLLSTPMVEPASCCHLGTVQLMAQSHDHQPGATCLRNGSTQLERD